MSGLCDRAGNISKHTHTHTHTLYYLPRWITHVNAQTHKHGNLSCKITKNDPNTENMSDADVQTTMQLQLQLLSLAYLSLAQGLEIAGLAPARGDNACPASRGLKSRIAPRSVRGPSALRLTLVGPVTVQTPHTSKPTREHVATVRETWRSRLVDFVPLNQSPAAALCFTGFLLSYATLTGRWLGPRIQPAIAPRASRLSRAHMRATSSCSIVGPGGVEAASGTVMADSRLLSRCIPLGV